MWSEAKVFFNVKKVKVIGKFLKLLLNLVQRCNLESSQSQFLV